MMVITISTLDESIERIEILNQGHPVQGGFPEDDDLRKYRWRTEGRRKEGHVMHHRGHGALKLAHLVISDLVGEGPTR